MCSTRNLACTSCIQRGLRARERAPPLQSLDKMYSQPAELLCTTRWHWRILVCTFIYLLVYAAVCAAFSVARACVIKCWARSRVLHPLDAGDGSSRDDDLGTKLFPLFPSFRTRFIIFWWYLWLFFRKMQSARAPTEFLWSTPNAPSSERTCGWCCRRDTIKKMSTHVLCPLYFVVIKRCVKSFFLMCFYI